MNLKARVTYRNRNMETIQECDYDLQDYVDMLSMDMKRIISDVEDLVYTANGNISKEDWDEPQILMFNKIKHKLLDKAGELSRLPSTLYDGDIETDNRPASFWRKVFDDKRG